MAADRPTYEVTVRLVVLKPTSLEPGDWDWEGLIGDGVRVMRVAAHRTDTPSPCEVCGRGRRAKAH